MNPVPARPPYHGGQGTPRSFVFNETISRIQFLIPVLSHFGASTAPVGRGVFPQGFQVAAGARAPHPALDLTNVTGRLGNGMETAVQKEIYDLIGIGFGPANLALAVALEEEGQGLKS